MPRRPSQANMIRYDVENFVSRKVELLHMFDVENAILCTRREETKRVYAELKAQNVCYEGGVPRDPEEARIFLENCEMFVRSPATNTAEHIIKASAAMTLSINMFSVSRDFPPHVNNYVICEISRRMDEMLHVPIHPHRVRHGRDGCRVVDETEIDALIHDPVGIEKKTFITPGSCPEDTGTFRVIGSGRSRQQKFWEVLFGGIEEPIRVDQAGLEEVLFDTIVYDDPPEVPQVD